MSASSIYDKRSSIRMLGEMFNLFMDYYDEHEHQLDDETLDLIMSSCRKGKFVQAYGQAFAAVFRQEQS